MLDIIILVSGILNLVLGLLVVFGGKNAKGMRAFASFAFATFFWALFNFFIYHSDNTLFDILTYVTFPIIVTCLLIWVYTFSLKEKEKLSFSVQFIIYFFGFTFAALAFFSDLIIFDIEKSSGSGFIEKTGVLFPVYASYIFLGYMVVLWKLIRLYRETEIGRKLQVRTVLIGFSIYGALGVFFSLILPVFGYEQLIDFDVPSSIIFVAFTSYAIINYRWMDIKLIAVELFSILLVIVTFIEFIIAPSTLLKVYGFLIFIVVTTLSMFMVRSVVVEVKRKEELQKISDALAIANERLKELDATKSEFISIASHQLRTPLTAIKGYISLLLEGSYGVVSPEVLDILNKLYSVNNRLVHLVEDLLNVSRIEAGRIQYSFAPTQLEPIIVELVDMFKPTAKDKKLTLEMKLLKNPLPLLTIDPNKIKEVLSNLIDNSLKYTVQGGVTVSLESTPSVARIIVSDTGIGIKPEDKGKLFEKFIRTSETTKMVASGAGLGLYVGKSFIEAHGGKIWAESDGEGKGSKFTIELPFKNPKIRIGTSDQPTTAIKG